MRAIPVILSVLLAGCNLSGTGQHQKAAKEATKAAVHKDESVHEDECDPTRDVRFSNGYTQYKCDKGRWVVDEEAMEWLRKEEKHKADLYWALRSRVLTVKEMAEVEQYGSSLLTRNMEPFMQEDVDKQFNAALLQQFRLRIAAGLEKPVDVEHKEQK